jgi:hypothetical protein
LLQSQQKSLLQLELNQIIEILKSIMKAQIEQQMAPEGVQTVLIKLFKKELEEVPSELKIEKC